MMHGVISLMDNAGIDLLDADTKITNVSSGKLMAVDERSIWREKLLVHLVGKNAWGCDVLDVPLNWILMLSIRLRLMPINNVHL